MSYTWEYDFLKMAADIFSLLVLGLLPVTAVIVFTVYMKKIITTWFDMHKLQLNFKQRSRGR